MGSWPSTDVAVTSNSDPAQMPNSPVADVTSMLGGTMSSTLTTMSTVVTAPSLSVASMVTVLMPGLSATNVPVKVAVPPLVVDSFSMKHSPARFWLITRSTVWLGSGPRNSTLRDVVWPKHREMVSQPKLAVGTGFKLLFSNAVLMLKNL